MVSHNKLKKCCFMSNFFFLITEIANDYIESHFIAIKYCFYCFISLFTKFYFYNTNFNRKIKHLGMHKMQYDLIEEKNS